MSGVLRKLINCEFPELFVSYVQPYLPTWLLRLLVWAWMKYCGPLMRSGDVVVQQINLDRKVRRSRPVTAEVEVTNEQLYANDPDFFLAHLGPKLKYSACEFPEGCKSLAEAEELTIAIYQEKADLASLPAGARVLELGCGWGSLSLTNAARYPHLNFVGFSNSPPQIKFIQAKAAERGIKNLSVRVEDYADFVDPSKSKVAPAGSAPFDAAFAIETVEHAQNIGELLNGAALRLKPGAKFFVHSLLHQSSSYLLSPDTWMGRNFYTGGSILALNSYFHLAPKCLHLADVQVHECHPPLPCLLARHTRAPACASALRILPNCGGVVSARLAKICHCYLAQPVSGTGYMKTSLAWLEMQEKNKHVFISKYGSEFYEGFRMFYIAVAEAFGANNGNEFMCGYYTFVKLDLKE